ncbi:hypothetical protein QT971_15650 [Microcoleus sp. herbarium19]|uniref:hypothetical protein n=1 Tax=Microcoleus sp. herbarium13 TaxID=3055438 RepID=UPI002FD6DDC3
MLCSAFNSTEDAILRKKISQLLYGELLNGWDAADRQHPPSNRRVQSGCSAEPDRKLKNIP